MKQEVLVGQVDYTVLVLIRDTAGAPKTGLSEASIDIAYARVETDNDVTTADVTPAALSALTDAHTDWGFEEVSATDHPGVYRLDIADAVFASGAWSAVVTIVGTGLDPTSIEFVLIAFNPRDGVRLGLTALPNAAADASGGLPISDAGGLDLDTLNSNVSAVLADTGTDGVVLANDAITAAKIAANAIGSSEIADGAITAAKFAAGAITATVIATDAIDADALAADAVAEINATVDSALADARLDELLAADSDIDGAAPPTVGSVFHELMSKTAGSFTYDQTTDSNEAIKDAITTPPTAAAIADQVWEEAIADHSGTSGSTAEALNAAGAAGDPWTTALPGAYGAGSAGNILGNRLVGTIATGTHNPQSGDAYARLGAPAGASVSADVAAVKTETAAIVADTGTDGVVVAAASKTGYALSAAGIQAIWDALTSALTTASSIGKLLVDNINATISSRLASASYTAPLDAAGTRSAVGLASANLDTQLSTIDSEVGQVLADTGTDGVIVATNNDKTGYRLSATGVDDVLDEVVEGSFTLRQMLRIIGGALAGELSGAATTTITIRNMSDTKAVITATVDSDGNRTALTLDGT